MVDGGDGVLGASVQVQAQRPPLLAVAVAAAVDEQQSWVFAVALLALGIPILIFFMIFEKKKTQILAAVNRFWNWERRDLIPSGPGDRLDK